MKIKYYNTLLGVFFCLLLVFPLTGVTATTSGKTTLKFSKNVKENHSKNIVQSIQNALIEAGYDPGIPDGFKGTRTSAALKSFQRDHDFKIDGKLDKKILKAIRNSLASDL